jgi:outer membrane protein assembly factor BamB
MTRTSFLAVPVALVLAGAAVSTPADWPAWRGPDRTGLSKETGLLKEWPASGPPLVWSISSLGNGYGSPAIQGQSIYIQGGGNQSNVFCLDRVKGETVWTKTLGPALEQDRGRGPRGTPTVDGDRIYVLSENGTLSCLKAAEGAQVWTRNILTDFKGSNPHWLLSESPLVDGNNLIVTPGGHEAGIVALDKMTGKTVWTSKELSDPAGYSSCVIGNVGGVRTIATLTASAGVGVRASDGKLMWRYPQVANRTANIATPVLTPEAVFYTSAYGTGCALLNLRAGDGVVKAEEAYFSREMMNHHGGVLLIGDSLYGFSNDILVCLDFKTGKSRWRNRSVGKGSLTYADGNLYLFSERNIVGLAVASPEGYEEKGRFSVQDQGFPSWAHPVVSGGRLYVRNQGVLACYNIQAKG